MMAAGTTKEIAMGNDAHEIVMKANGAIVQIHPDGNLDVFTDHTVRAHPAARGAAAASGVVLPFGSTTW